MPDREKVINQLDVDIQRAEQTGEMLVYVGRKTAKEVLSLLKEQEAKQVIKQTYHVMMNRDYENHVEATRYDWLCPTCKSLLRRDIDVIDDNYHFCKVCGQAVKWE